VKPSLTSSNQPIAPHGTTDWSRLRSLIFGGIHARLVVVAVQLGIPDVLAARALTTQEIARHTRTQSLPLRHVLRALTADGLLEEVAPDTFELTDVGRLLVDDPAGSRRNDALLIGDHVDRVFAHVLDAVRTGEPAGELAFGRPYFEWLNEHPEAAAIFNNAMTLGARAALPTLLELDVWSRARTVVDVGGGNGTAIAALLREHEHLRGVVFDLPHAASAAAAVLEAAGVSGRASFEAGSFFERVPTGADVYVAVQVLHNWPDEEASRILRRIREAITQNGRLLLIEVVVADDEPSATAFVDAVSFFWLGGTERTKAAWRQLLERSGFRLDRIRPREWVSAIEALPA
jgi:SAM-dependent methyltransferase